VDSVAEEPEKKKKIFEFIRPNAQKILFLRATPLTTLVPAQYAYHWGKIDKVTFVDLDKNSIFEGFYDKLNAVKADFKSFKMPEGNVVATAMAGNGIDKIVNQFDVIVVITPPDKNVLRTFVARYDGMFEYGILIDKMFRGTGKLNEYKEIAPNAKFYNTVKITEMDSGEPITALEIWEAEGNGSILPDDYLNIIKFLIKDLAKE
jgi:hypothetical protein